MTYHAATRVTFIYLALLAITHGRAASVGAQVERDPASTESHDTRAAGLGIAQRANVVTVVARDFAFEMPDTIAAGLTTFRLRNAGTQPHHLMFYRLDRGKHLADVLTALNAGGAHPAWMHAVGGPNAILPGAETAGTLVLQPGTYVAFCHVKSPDNMLHFAKGMMKIVTVSPTARAPTILPAADITVTLNDYAFTFSHPPTRGHHLMAVINRGTQPHELILSKLLPGKTSQDFIHWMDTQQGAPPVIPAGGATDLPPRGTLVIPVDLESGRYSIVCRVRDAKDGQPHDRHGMFTEFTVQ